MAKDFQFLFQIQQRYKECTNKPLSSTSKTVKLFYISVIGYKYFSLSIIKKKRKKMNTSVVTKGENMYFSNLSIGGYRVSMFRRGLRGETRVDVMAQLRYQQQAGRVDEADGHERRFDRDDQGSRADGVLGAQGHLLHRACFPPAPVRLGVQARGAKAEARAQVPRRPLQQGVHRQEARLDLERQVAAGAPGIQTGQGLQTKC